MSETVRALSSEREAFEKWARTRKTWAGEPAFKLEGINSDGSYCHHHTQDAWMAWQARAERAAVPASPEHPPAVPVELAGDSDLDHLTERPIEGVQPPLPSLDQFHRHEALDRASLVADERGDTLLDHPYLVAHPALRSEVEYAMRLISDVYQEIGAHQPLPEQKSEAAVQKPQEALGQMTQQNARTK